MNAKTPALITVLLLTMTGLAFAAESATETFQKAFLKKKATMTWQQPSKLPNGHQPV